SSSADSEESRRITADRLYPKFFSLRIFCLGNTVGVQNQKIAGREVGSVDLTGYAVEHSDREAGRVHGNNLPRFCVKKESGIVAAVDVPERPTECINVRQQQCDVTVAVGYGMDPAIQAIYNLQHVSFLTRLQLHGSRGGGHQERSRNTLSRDISNHDLDRMLIDGHVVVVVAAHTSHRPHRPGDLQSSDGWATERQKHPLNLRG